MNKRCIHNRRKSICKECHGSQICCHNRRKDMCYECGYKPKKCIHNKERSRCIECKINSFLIV